MKKIVLISFLLCAFSVNSTELVYPNGAKKAVIFSYDDGLIQDKKLIKLFNQYKVVGTFNLNSGLFGQNAPWLKKLLGKTGVYLTVDEVPSLYKGHEIAGHSHSHPGLAGLDSIELLRQLTLDKTLLASLAQTQITSFAYPLGSYDDAAKEALLKVGFTNARTVKDSRSFDVPSDFLAWHPTVHHSNAMILADEFVQLTPKTLKVMVIWGHSWEFDQNKAANSWQYAEALIKKLSNKEDIWYVSMGEFSDFITASRQSK